MRAYDPSDARGRNADGTPGSGVGFAPTTSDHVGRGEDEEHPYIAPNDRSSADFRDDDIWPNDRSDAREFGDIDSPHGSGAQSGSPELEYLPPRDVGYDEVDISPFDGGMRDTLRESDTPTRIAVNRFQYTMRELQSDIAGEFGRERELVGSEFRGAQQSRGRMSPMDEYRLLGDGSHA